MLKMSIARQCLLSSFNRLSISNPSNQRCLGTATSPLLFWVTQVAWAEPLKKKKKADPQVTKMREDKKKRKLAKQIRRLEKNSRQLKPLDEMDVPLSLIQEKELRKRTIPAITEEQQAYRSNLLKQWSVYKNQQSMAEVYMMDSIQISTNKALEELYKESKDLWLEAIQIDPMLIPFNTKGPVSTPPIKDFDSPDGEYINETKKWD